MTAPIRSMMSRRVFLGGAAGLAGAVLVRNRWVSAEPAFETPADVAASIAGSPLIYLTPLRSDGSESRCQAEVWFIADGNDVLVVTTPERWRSQAIEKGLHHARIWVGDFGPWKKSDGRYKTAPTFLAHGERAATTDPAFVESVLARFGSKYPDSWDKYGPRFRDGLADGSRVLLRYRPAAA